MVIPSFVINAFVHCASKFDLRGARHVILILTMSDRKCPDCRQKFVIYHVWQKLALLCTHDFIFFAV